MHAAAGPHGWKVTALLLVLLACPGAAKDPDGKEKKPRPANRLARESSPYLLQHAHNPVSWYPWGEEAFARAKKEGKLIFLSIGYSSCHWCHVMERESFSREDVARILNDHFVCIKVDREERPDVDNIYMTALQVLGRPSGWPLSMFLTPEGKPIVGGTYWPPEDRELDGVTVAGFKTVLQRMLDVMKEQPEEVRKHADGLAERVTRTLTGTAFGVPLITLEHELVQSAIDELRERFDEKHGGFGSPTRGFRGPKFPTPPYLALLLGEAGRKNDDKLRKMAEKTLDELARGGIYDHLGGGFHRYSTERTWSVPHFEKMLYDNAQLCEVYALAYSQTKNPAYRRVVEDTLSFVSREMTSPEGGFYSALDADSEEEEGRFYVWTPGEIDAALKDVPNGQLFRQIYLSGGEPNFENKYHILRLDRPLGEWAREKGLTEEKLVTRLAPIRKKLLADRAKRPSPFLDTKILTAWNGQMIAGAAVAGAALRDRAALDMARKAASFVLTNLRSKDGRLLRSYSGAPGAKPQARLNAYLDDYAYLIHGLLCLHDATGEARWLDEARKLADVMVEHYQDPRNGAFFYTSHDHEKLFARAKDQYDGAQPAGNSLAARSFVRLWQKTGEQRYQVLAEKTLRGLAPALKTGPGSLTSLADALGLYLQGVKKEE